MNNIGGENREYKQLGKQLHEKIVQNIKTRVWDVGYQLPSLRQMQSDSKISICTVRKVLDELVLAGLLTVKHGRGFFVAGPAEGGRNVAIVLPSIGGEHISIIVSGIKKTLAKFGINLIIYSAESDFQEEMDMVSKLDRMSICGAIIYPPPSPKYAKVLDALKSRNVPFILVNTALPEVKTDSVTVDNGSMGELAINHLAERGHRKIGIISQNATIADTKELFAGMRKAAQSHGLDFSKFPQVLFDPLKLTFPASAGWRQVANDVAAFLKIHSDLTALIATNEHYTVGCILAAQELKLAIPEDISLLGMGEYSALSLTTPAITMITQPYRDIGRIAAERLLHSLNNKEDGIAAFKLPPQMQERDSVRELK